MAAFDGGVFDAGVFDVAATGTIVLPTPGSRRSAGTELLRRAIGLVTNRRVAPNLQARRTTR